MHAPRHDCMRYVCHFCCVADLHHLINCRLVTRWNEDPLSLGSYSFPRPSAEHPHLPFLRASHPVWPYPLPRRFPAPAPAPSLVQSVSSLTPHTTPNPARSPSSPVAPSAAALGSSNSTHPALPDSVGMANRHEHEPLHRLYFAGEHCSVLRCGYADGAYDSGVEAAQRVIRSLPSSFTSTSSRKAGAQTAAEGGKSLRTSKL